MYRLPARQWATLGPTPFGLARAPLQLGKKRRNYMPPLAIPIVMFLACGGLLWLIAYMLAPVGYEISLWRGVGAVLLMGIAGPFSTALLRPAFGWWHVVAELMVSIFIVSSVLRLPLSRSVAAVFIYWIVIIGAAYFLFIRPHKSRHHAAAKTECNIAANLPTRFGET